MSVSADLISGQLMSLAPPGGELVYLVNDLDQLTGSESEKRKNQMKEIFEKNYVCIKFDSVHKFRVSKFNQLELEEPDFTDAAPSSCVGYYSNDAGNIFCVHFGKEFYIEKLTRSQEEPGSPGSPRQQSSLVRELRSLLSSTGPTNLCASVLETDRPDVVVIVTGITEHMENNFWSVHCHCVWTVARCDEDEYSVSGEVNTTVHYFEGCNFRLTVPKWKVGKTSNLGSTKAVLDLIKKKIFKFKNKLHNKIFIPDPESVDKDVCPLTPGGRAHPSSANENVATYAPQHNTVLKKLRRQLPVHRSKFDWNLARLQFQQQFS